MHTDYITYEEIVNGGIEIGMGQLVGNTPFIPQNLLKPHAPSIPQYHI